MRIIQSFIIFSIFTVLMNIGCAQTNIPPLTGGVMDHASLLSSTEKQNIHNKIMKLETETGSQIAVLIIPTLNNENIVNYGVRVMEKWQLGRKGVDDGVLLIVALNDRKMRLEIGYGLEGAIPDITAQSILNQYLIPYFKQGNYSQGITNTVDVIIAKINNEPLPTLNEKPLNTPKSTDADLFLLVLLSLIIIPINLLLKNEKNSGAFINPLIIIVCLSIIVGFHLHHVINSIILSIAYAIIVLCCQIIYQTSHQHAPAKNRRWAIALLQSLPFSLLIMVLMTWAVDSKVALFLGISLFFMQFLFITLWKVTNKFSDKYPSNNSYSGYYNTSSDQNYYSSSNSDNSSSSSSSSSQSDSGDRSGGGGSSGGGGASDEW